MSTAEWLSASVPAGAREAAAAFVTLTTFVADHETLSADAAALQLRLAAWPGVRYLRGGWQSLVDALAARATRSGAEVRTRSAVRALERQGDGWTVATDDESYAAGAVVLAAGTPAAVRDLVGDRVTAPGPEAEVSCLDLGLRRLPRAKRTFALGIDDPVYMSRHSPPKHAAGTLMSLAGYTRQPREHLERAADAVQPGWREEVVLTRHLPRMVPVAGLATPGTGGLPGRPGVAVADAPGMFVAGDWVGPEGWLVDAALASGVAAARAALA
jgi:phytoene dehydrogenase-like protein